MTVTKTPNGKRWRAQVKSRGKVVADKTFDRKGDALRYEQEQKRALDLGTYIDPRRGREALGDVVDRWMLMRAHSLASKTLQTEGYSLRKHLPPTLRNTPIGAVRTSDLENLHASMLGALSPRTVSRFRNIMVSMFSWAVAEGLVPVNVAEKSRVPRGSGQGRKREPNPFTSSELLEVVADVRADHPDEADVIFVLGTSGMRWGELEGLRVRDVQLVPKPYYRISRSAPSGQPVRNITKGGKPRSVPIPEAVLPIVKARIAGKAPDDLVFASPAGKRLDGPNFKRKIDWTKYARDRVIHDLRHTACTVWLVELGIDPKTVQTWAGHASLTTTVDTYAHWMGTDADDAGVAKVNGLYGHASGTRAGKLRAAE